MKQHTYWDRIIAGLKHLGWQQVENSKCFKYAEFSHPGYKAHYFVGKMGALRFGVVSTRSFSVGDPSHQTKAYLEWLARGDEFLSGSQFFGYFEDLAGQYVGPFPSKEAVRAHHKWCQSVGDGAELVRIVTSVPAGEDVITPEQDKNTPREH